MIGLSIFAVGIMIICVPSLPSLIVGSILISLPIVSYLLALAVVAAVDLVNRICCAIVNKYEEGKTARTPSQNSAIHQEVTVGNSVLDSSNNKQKLTFTGLNVNAAQYGDPRTVAGADKNDGLSKVEMLDDSGNRKTLSGSR